MKNVLSCTNRAEFRAWLENNSQQEKECCVCLKRGQPKEDGYFYYLDAVEEALCFGWIDSTVLVVDGKSMQRFSPRTKKSPWTELNKERVRRLERLGLMTDSGRKVLPPMGPRSFKVPKEIEKALKDARAWKNFKSFPPLYQRIRAYNVEFYKKKDPTTYQKALSHLVEMTKQGKMFGEWTDYGRLLEK